MLGVCLKYEQNNYGSKLQALATIGILDDMGIEYEIIRYRKGLKFYIRTIPRFLNIVFLNDRYDQIQRKIEYHLHRDVLHKVEKRKECMSLFDREHFLDKVEFFRSYKALTRECAQRYNGFLTCSDQLWSPSALGSGFYNLMFAPGDKVKVSWASSFGVGKIPWYQIKRTKRYLERIEHISVRENQGAVIVKELTGRDVPVLMDPVFVYDHEYWESLAGEPICESNEYIFCYFLGANQSHRRAARELAAKTGLKIVTLRHLDRYVPEDEHFGDYAPYDVDPMSFLGMIRNAKYVCTDSFHGAAFSIIFGKQFVVFDRYNQKSSNSKNSRIDSLCENLGLGLRRYTADCDILKIMNAKIDYSVVNGKLAYYRYKTLDYLKYSLR